jgi:hypothetical protein
MADASGGDIWGKMKGPRRTLPRARADWHQAQRQGFTLHVHRLPSL